MSLVVVRKALRPSAPTITGHALSGTTTEIDLTVPSVGTQTTISRYILQTRVSGIGSYVIYDANVSPVGFPYSVGGLTPGTSYDYQLLGVDNTSQRGISLPSNTVTVTNGGTGFKFLDGLQQIGFTLDPNASVASWISRMGQLKSQVPLLRLVQVYINQAVLENPSLVGGDAQYDGSWDGSGNSGGALITKLLAAATANNLMLGINIQTAAYNAPSTSFPSWLIAGYMGGSAYGPTSGSPGGASGAFQGGAWFSSNTSNSGGYTDSWLWWTTAIQPRVMSMNNWYAGRFNTHPNLYFWCNLGESAIPGVTNYNSALAVPFYTGTYFPGMDSTWTQTMRRAQLNYETSDDNMAAIIAAANTHRIITWGPDCALETGSHSRVFQANYVYRGLKGGIGGTHSYPDFVGIAGFGLEAQYASLSDTVGGYGPTKFANGDIPTMLTTMASLQAAFIFMMYDQANSGWNSVRTTSNAPTASPPTGGGPLHPNAIDQYNAVLTQTVVNGAPVTAIVNTSRPAGY